MCIVLLHVKFQLKQKATVKVTAETVWRVKKSSFSAQFSTSLGGGTIYKRESIQLYCVCTHYSWTGFNKRISSAVLCENILQLNWFSVVCLYSIVHSALCFLISAFSFQPSAVSFQPSAFIFQPSAFSLQPSAFSLQPIMFWGLSGFKIRGFKRRGFTTTTEIGFLCRMIGFLWTTAKAAYWGGVPPPKNYGWNTINNSSLFYEWYMLAGWYFKILS